MGHFPNKILVPPATTELEVISDETKKNADGANIARVRVAAVDYWENPIVTQNWVKGLKKKPSVVAEPFTRYRSSIMDSVASSGYYVAMMEEPVTHFMRAWHTLVSKDPKYVAI